MWRSTLLRGVWTNWLKCNEKKSQNSIKIIIVVAKKGVVSINLKYFYLRFLLKVAIIIDRKNMFSKKEKKIVAGKGDQQKRINKINSHDFQIKI